jgi:hypothetical protein
MHCTDFSINQINQLEGAVRGILALLGDSFKHVSFETKYPCNYFKTPLKAI